MTKKAAPSQEVNRATTTKATSRENVRQAIPIRATSREEIRQVSSTQSTHDGLSQQQGKAATKTQVSSEETTRQAIINQFPSFDDQPQPNQLPTEKSFHSPPRNTSVSRQSSLTTLEGSQSLTKSSDMVYKLNPEFLAKV